MHAGRTSEDSSRDEPSARYKYQRLREALREAIESGALSGKLPGERELARRYEANAKTINKALCDLTTEGLLVRHVGRGTFVATGQGAPGSSGRKLRTYAWVAASTDKTLKEGLLFRLAESLLRERGHRLTAWPADPAAGGELAETAVSAGQLRSWDGLVLAGRTSERLLAELHRRHLPVIMVQNTHARVRTSAVVADYAQGAFELAQLLIRLGHRDIRLVMAEDLMPAAASAEAGYRAALARNQLAHLECLIADGGFDWSGLLIGTGRPSAIVCVGSALAARAAGAAHRVGLQLPTALSLCAVLEGGCMPPEPLITAYEVNADAIAHWTVELLVTATPGQMPRVVIVPGELHDRGSASIPPGGPAPDGQWPSEAVL